MRFQLLSLLHFALAWPPSQAQATQGQLAKAHTVFQLDNNNTWFENLATRSNGDILATRLDSPELWLIDPSTRRGRSVVTVHGVLSTIGITEHRPGVFVLGAGNLTVNPLGIEPGSMKLFQLDFRQKRPSIQLITAMPQASLINGITPFSQTEVLVSDINLGVVYKVNVAKGASEIVLSGPDFAGINGIRVQNSFLYYASTSNETFFRVPIDDNATATGAAEVIAVGVPMDDFALMPDGTAYIATMGLNQVVRVDPDGRLSTLAGAVGSLDVAGGTSARFGSSRNDRLVLYVTTNGGTPTPVNGAVTEPAKIVAVKVKS
ncbi:SGL domain-containing protein [Fusarium sp. LHS14.1]|nr:SGL domain-containing protein [Fusarium sp. LHS14.1]